MKIRVIAGALLLSMLISCGGQSANPATPETDEGGENAFREIESVPELSQALPASARASSSAPGNEPYLAVDGKLGSDSSWSSEGGMDQWIRLDFESPAEIERIVVVISQPSAAETHHVLWVEDGGLKGRMLAEIKRETHDHQALEFIPSEPLQGISSLMLATLDAPSPAAWEEILVFGSMGAVAEESEPVESEPEESEPEEPALQSERVLLFVNGVIITMDTEQPQAEALVVVDDRIAFVGDEAEARALVGDDTVEIDLEGQTLMPGFIDSHTHVLTRADYWDTDLEGVQDMLIANGITAVGDAFVREEKLLEYMELEETANLRVRTTAYLAYSSACGELFPMWFTNYTPEEVEPGDMLRWDGVKIFTDGGTCGHPAYSIDHDQHGFGDLWFNQQELTSMLKDVHDQGSQAMIHAIGDRAVDATLHAIEKVSDGGENIQRHRIEHNMFVRPDQYARYGELDVVAAFFGVYANCIYDDVVAPPAGTEIWEWPYTRIMAANPGLHVAWHSDAPYMGPPDPIAHLFSMVTDEEVGWDRATTCPTPWWISGRDFTVEQVLPMMTIDAAYAIRRDDELGSLKPGKLADLVVLSADPTTIPAENLLSIEVLVTMVGGESAYCAESSLCP